MYMDVISGDGPLRSHKVMSSIQHQKYIRLKVSDWITDLQKINTHKHLVMFTQLGLLIETCGVGGGGGLSSTTTSVQHPLV